MKRKIMMVSLAMVTGLPHAVSAKNGKDVVAPGYSSWNSPYMPHYGGGGRARPLMDHASAAGVSRAQGTNETWQLEFAHPVAVSSADDTLKADGLRMGFNLKLGF